MKETQIEATPASLNLALEELPPRGPPNWQLAQTAHAWMSENPDLYPTEADLPQEGPSLDDYASHPVYPD